MGAGLPCVGESPASHKGRVAVPTQIVPTVEHVWRLSHGTHLQFRTLPSSYEKLFLGLTLELRSDAEVDVTVRFGGTTETVNLASIRPNTRICNEAQRAMYMAWGGLEQMFDGANS